MGTVSVVVPAFNEARHIGRCLRSLKAQEPCPREVIVVDDGSTDRTALIVEELGVRLIRTQHRGPALARNVGAQAASGEILVFLDADMACEPGFVSALVAPIRGGSAIGSFTKELYLGNPQSCWARAYCRIRRLGNPRLLPDSFPDSWANYRAILRERFLSSGGYEDVGYGEDMTLAPKVGCLAVSRQVQGAYTSTPIPFGRFLRTHDGSAGVLILAKWRTLGEITCHGAHCGLHQPKFATEAS